MAWPDADRADRLARDWVDFAFRWARIRRAEHGDAIDWEQAAIDGLAGMIRGFRPAPGKPNPSVRYALRCLGNAGTAQIVKARRRARLAGRFRPIPDGFDVPGRECGPDWQAIIDEEVRRHGGRD